MAAYTPRSALATLPARFIGAFTGTARDPLPVDPYWRERRVGTLVFSRQLSVSPLAVRARAGESALPVEPPVLVTIRVGWSEGGRERGHLQLSTCLSWGSA